MRTYVSPIGYDTRRVTRPVINTGLGGQDTVVLLRPSEESDTSRSEQTVADVEQLLQEVEPAAECNTTRVSTGSFEATMRECCDVLSSIPAEREVTVSLGGGARDVLLPLTVTALVFAGQIDRALFFSDLDSTVQEWTLPNLTAQVPDRTLETFETIFTGDEWLSLSTIADETGQSKSTVVRHVNDLEDAGIVEADANARAKQVRINSTGELLWLARNLSF